MVHGSHICGKPYLGHFRWFDLLDLKEVSYSEESNSHSTDADHKNDQRWTVTYVGLQILQWIQQQHLQQEKNPTSLGKLSPT